MALMFAVAHLLGSGSSSCAIKAANVRPSAESVTLSRIKVGHVAI